MFDGSFQLELTRPMWLLGLLALPFLVYYFYWSLVDLPRRQRLVSLVTRSIIVTLLLLALAGLTLLKPTRDLFVIFAIDRSLSVGDESRKAADEFVAKATETQGKNRHQLIVFAAETASIGTDGKAPVASITGNGASLERPAGAPASADQSLSKSQSDAIGADKATDIAAALETAAASIPPHYVPRIVLLSDGNETRGDALKSVLNGKIGVYPVPLKTRENPEVQVSAVTVPAQVAEGEPFFVEVKIDSNHETDTTIEVYRGAHKVIGETRKLQKGENVFRFRQSIERERLAEFAVRVSGGQDTLLDNNSASGLVFSAGKPKVLLIESAPELAKNLEWALQEEGILVDTRPPQGLPDSLADLQNYELLMISNVPATAISARKMEVIRTYVQELGGGLIMLGGDQSFGLGGYYKTVLEEILPVRSDFEKEKEKPSLAMVIIIDKSGSMGGEKIELAKDAAKSAVELLGPRDQVGVIAFDGEPYWISEIRSRSDLAYLVDRISSIEASGGTTMYPAMEEANKALQNATAKLKHVIILTDGISSPGDFQGLAQQMAAARMTVSTVGVGEGADQNLLEEIAKIGNGRYYFTDDPQSVPQIFAKETMTASKSAINEQPFVPQVLRPTQVLSDIDFASAPFLLGYVVTRAKPTSEVVLVTEKGDPLLSWWRYGLGMSVAFTSDAKSRWAAEWLTWPGFNRFWAQVIRNTMRKSEAKGFLVDVSRNGSKAKVTLDSVDPAGNFLNDAETEITLIDPDLQNSKVAMSQVAPGRYVGEIETNRSGAYHLELAQKHKGQILYRQSRGLMVGYSDELRLRPANVDLLEKLAKHSGGKFDPQPADIFAADESQASRAILLWPYLTMVALVLFLADVALRRIDFSLVLPRKRYT